MNDADPAVSGSSAEVEILAEDPRWEAWGLEPVAREAVTAALAALGLPPEGFSVSILGCDDARIRSLNAEFRGRDRPTNVLSWPSAERGAEQPGAMPLLPGPGPHGAAEELGDIAISWDTTMREAVERGLAPRDHVVHLLVHGLLHLLGFDHEREADAKLMEDTERRILAGLGIADPYAEGPPENGSDGKGDARQQRTA